MQNDCEIYVDPEEDEVFFGCVSEREKTVCAKLVIPAGSTPRDETKFDKAEREEIDNKLIEPISMLKETSLEDQPDSTTPQEIKTLFEKEESSKILSNNTSVELEHNYSTPMKHKIDKSILATPKSVVKADKDGGFLKVLSEIALVKAEAEGDEKTETKDEDKENKIVSGIPEIKITEATPEKGAVASPPKNIDRELRRFRIIYNSPLCEDNKPKSFESEKNFKNKCLDEDEKWKAVDLIDFNEFNEPEELNVSILLEVGETLNDSQTTDDKKDEVIILDGKTDCESIKKSPKAVIASPRPLEADLPKGLRFSKDAKKIVEVLKKSTLDDTLNFTIPEINVEEEENSFLSPGPVSGLDETVISKVPETKFPKSVEKDIRKQTPVVSQKKLQPMRYFSERKIHNQISSETKKFVRKLPLEEKRPATVEKVSGGRSVETNAVISSRIPVFGVKNSKIPLNERIARTVTAKITPSKTLFGKNQKKFNHIESPINAYIHNKPTSLVVNVKPEIKKDSLTKMWKAQTTGSEKKEEKKNQKKPSSAVKLPFVEYESATPYKIEKRPESRLPRLAPTVMKLIGSHSPKVLRHEGRFFVNTPRKQSSTDNTIVADQNEISVVVSQPAQKTNTIK